ncbi:YhjD/YihY/BrkB family envelope integrity protein [Corynebacterium pacaense]|uniref:YhjD/YihY/BrkB family envelope integrity protein n=1 Tax=Corynebacterium pacaense TaxID=1816684 RepID=UPI0009BC4CC3|nr:YhjD/YihY/BrkB family envelope integrity protein [Corynebacterium pacaense]
MAEKTRPDEFGIERSNRDELGVVDKVRERSRWIDHLMRMNERYGSKGGNQLSAGITYFSVLSVFPLAMLVFGIAGVMLARNPEVLQQIQDEITNALEGDIGSTVNQIIDTAIAQRGTVLGVGGLTALWSGLGWMDNLRFGVSRMWAVDPTSGSFLNKKIKDLIALVVLILALILAFGITAVGASGATTAFLGFLGLEAVPGISYITWVIAVAIGVVANFFVFFWMIVYLPRTKVPRRPGVQAALLGAVAFEVVKQLGSLLASNALNNPAGVAFGPIIGIMVVLYLIWRILLYCSAWAATSEESLKNALVPAPEPAVIQVRTEISPVSAPTDAARKVGIGVAVGAAAAGALALLRRN